MKEKLLLIFLSLGLVCFAQVESSLLSEDSVPSDSIVLLYDTLPAFTFFNAETIETHTSKIASLQKSKQFDYQFFILTLLFSLLLTVLFVKYKSVVKASFKSIIDYNFSYQYIRIQKHNNILPYLLFTLIFVLSLSMYFYFGFAFTYYYLLILFATVIFLIYDLLSNYLFILFTNKNVKDQLLYSTFSHYTFAVVLLWPFLLLIHVNLPHISKGSFLVYLAILILLAFIKLFSLVSILRQEKVRTFSFHFFIYLCTFKIAPVLILLKLLF